MILDGKLDQNETVSKKDNFFLKQDFFSFFEGFLLNFLFEYNEKFTKRSVCQRMRIFSGNLKLSLVFHFLDILLGTLIVLKFLSNFESLMY